MNAKGNLVPWFRRGDIGGISYAVTNNIVNYLIVIAKTGSLNKAAEQLYEAAKDGPFLSKDDLRQRSKISKSLIDLMGDLGLLGDMPESNQLSLFDFVSSAGTS